MFAALHHHLPCGQEKGRSFQMQKLSRIAIAAGLLMCPPAGALLAQTTPSTDTPATTTAPAATPAPAPSAQPAPAAQPATPPPTAATTTPPPAATTTTTTTEKDA